MNAIRRLLLAALVCAAFVAPVAFGDQAVNKSAGLQIQISVVVLGKCEFGSAPAQAVQCRRGVAFVDKPAVLEQVVDPVEPEQAVPVMVREVAF